MSQRKDFSKPMYKKYDKIAKKTAVEFFQQYNYELVDNNDISKEYFSKGDLVIQRKDTKIPFMIEVEIKNPWKVSGRWQPQFDTIDFLESKIGTNASYWVLFNYTLDTLLVASLDTIRQSPVKTKDALIEDGTRTKDEEYRKIPIPKCKFYKKTTLGWEPTNATS